MLGHGPQGHSLRTFVAQQLTNEIFGQPPHTLGVPNLHTVDAVVRRLLTFCLKRRFTHLPKNNNNAGTTRKKKGQ
jgi:hypothetical protein